ncbi:hypothetical protein HWV62_11343 [Athelia sp. TMB]|nr:hypothetical protein HWV62_11343 [Athelia sp. TMB]
MKCRKCNQLDPVFERLEDSIIPYYPRPLPTLLLSHAVPSAIEEENARSSIKAIDIRLAQLADHAVHLDTLVRELKQEQDRCAAEQRSLMDCKTEYKSVNAPVKTVPDDALIEIFTAFTAANPYTHKHLPAPMALAGVCRRWRDVCINTHSLWSRISLRVSRDACYEAKTGVFRIFASRAGTSLLQVGIRDKFYTEHHLRRNIEPAGLQLLIDEMAASAGRWQMFGAICSWALLERIWEGICQAHPKEPLRMLQKLKVVCSGFSPRSSVLSSPLDLSYMLPSLRHAWLGPLSSTILLLHWKALEIWGGVLVAPESFVDVLTKCPNLSQCTSLTFYEDGAITAPFAPVRHQRLHTLVLSFGCSRRDFQYFFNGLALPALLDLRLHLNYRTVWAHQEFSDFLDRSSCALQRLVLDLGAEFRSIHIDLLDIIALVPSLTEFEFVEGRLSGGVLIFNHDVLQALTCGALLPNLQTLSLIGRLAHDLPAMLIPMLRSRTQTTSALQSMFLQLHPPESGQDAKPDNVLTVAGAHTVQTALADTALQIAVIYDASATQNSIAFPPL